MPAIQCLAEVTPRQTKASAAHLCEDCVHSGDVQASAQLGAAEAVGHCKEGRIPSSRRPAVPSAHVASTLRLHSPDTTTQPASTTARYSATASGVRGMYSATRAPAGWKKGRKKCWKGWKKVWQPDMSRGRPQLSSRLHAGLAASPDAHIHAHERECIRVQLASRLLATSSTAARSRSPPYQGRSALHLHALNTCCKVLQAFAALPGPKRASMHAASLIARARSSARPMACSAAGAPSAAHSSAGVPAASARAFADVPPAGRAALGASWHGTRAEAGVELPRAASAAGRSGQLSASAAALSRAPGNQRSESGPAWAGRYSALRPR
jgi:hypothetical protein